MRVRAFQQVLHLFCLGCSAANVSAPLFSQRLSVLPAVLGRLISISRFLRLLNGFVSYGWSTAIRPPGCPTVVPIPLLVGGMTIRLLNDYVTLRLLLNTSTSSPGRRAMAITGVFPAAHQMIPPSAQGAHIYSPIQRPPGK